MGNNPEVAKAFAGYWDMLHRGGTVPHDIKELARIQIAQMVVASSARDRQSPLAASITEEQKMSCALPNWEHPDPRLAPLSTTRARLRSTMTGRGSLRGAEEILHLRGNHRVVSVFCLTPAAIAWRKAEHRTSRVRPRDP